MESTVFCDVTPCNLPDVYRRFGGTYLFCLKDQRVRYGNKRSEECSVRLHGVTSPKLVLKCFTAFVYEVCTLRVVQKSLFFLKQTFLLFTCKWLDAALLGEFLLGFKKSSEVQCFRCLLLFFLRLLKNHPFIDPLFCPVWKMKQFGTKFSSSDSFRYYLQVVKVTLHFIGKHDRVSSEKPVAVVFQEGTDFYLEEVAWYSD
jgi:hypothetical protein